MTPASHDGYVPAEYAKLYYRDVGQGQPLIILHGGPSLDHTYLLPDMDHLSTSFRLIYYDQRGRGKSAAEIVPTEVTVQSDIEDLERLRRHFGLNSVALLGHSWGGLLALEYAVRFPNRVSHLILMNTAPASQPDYDLFQQELLKRRTAADVERLKRLSADATYQEGDPSTVAAYDRMHFRVALRRPEHLDQVMENLRSSSTQEGILKGRAIANRLMGETWLTRGYDLLPRLKRLIIKALVLHGDSDFIPLACATHIAQAITGAHLIVLRDCGHFAYLERPNEVREAVGDFMRSA